MSTEIKSPVMSGVNGAKPALARSNRDWWPNQLALEILHQNSPLSNPMGEEFNYAENFNALLSTCQQRNVAVQTIKSIAYKPWMGRKHTRNVWYEPLEDQQDIDLAVHWVLKQPGIFLNTAGDIHLLPRVLEAADRFQAASPGSTDEQMRTLVTRLGMEPLFV